MLVLYEYNTEEWVDSLKDTNLSEVESEVGHNLYVDQGT